MPKCMAVYQHMLLFIIIIALFLGNFSNFTTANPDEIPVLNENIFNEMITNYSWDCYTNVISSRMDVIENENLLDSYSKLQNKPTTLTIFPPDDRVRITDTTLYPWCTICKLYIYHPSGLYTEGTGFMVDEFHVLTAGHCAYLHEEDGWPYDSWASSIKVIPGMNNGYEPYGHTWCVTARSYDGWVLYHMYQHDWALLTLDDHLGAYTGWMGRETAPYWSSIYTGILNTAGYPGDLDSGLNMYYCSGNGIDADEYNHYFNMDAFGGQSGSPVWRLDGSNRYVLSILTTETPFYNFGTRLNQQKFNDLNAWLNDDSPSNPCLSYSPISYDFGNVPEGEIDKTTFEIWNSGTGTLSYTLSENCSWCSVFPASGSSTGEHDTITVNIDTTGLSAGHYSCNIAIESNGGSGTFGISIDIVEPPNNPPVANFTYEPIISTTQDIIYFNSTSYDPDGSIVNWTWDFGDGDVDYSEFVTHQYSDNGMYNVSLMVTDDDGATDPVQKQISVSNVPPTADFGYAPLNPSTADILQFTDLSYDIDGSIINWTWDFGDGNTSTEQNPTHVYGNNGTYTVTLTIWDNDGATDTVSKQITVINLKPVANFSWDPLTPNQIIENVTLNASQSYDTDGEIINYTWLFGDNTTGYGKTVNHTYGDEGSYNVTLTVKDDDNAIDSITKTIYVKNTAPTADFAYSPTSPLTLETVQFTDASTDIDGIIVNYTWDFGDGNISYLQNPIHRYNTDGTFNVTLTITDDDNTTDSISKGIIVVMCTANVYTDKGYYIVGENVTCGINNTLTRNITVGCLSIQHFVNRKWVIVDGPFCTQLLLSPNEKWELIWNMSDQTELGRYRVKGEYDIDGVNCLGYAYFNITEGDSNGNPIICGYIIDADGGYIVNATVSIYQWETGYENSTLSNSSGFYSMSVPIGEVLLEVYAEGYSPNPYSNWVYIDGDTEENVTLYCQNSVIRGKITADSEDGPLINDTEVTIYLDWYGDDGEYDFNSTSTGSGSYSINVASGEVYLQFYADGYSGNSTPLYSIGPNEMLWINVSLLSENSIIYGNITDGVTGEGISNAEVTVYWSDDQGEEYWKKTYTNSSGYYELSVAAVNVNLSAEADGYFTEYINVGFIAVNESMEVNVSLYGLSNPSPADGATRVDVDTDLSWTCTAPDGGITYDVYFGTINPPPLVSPGQSSSKYNLGSLKYSTTYYWQIIAWNEEGERAEGPVWHFTTEKKSSSTPPNVPSNPIPANGTTFSTGNKPSKLSWSGGDPNNDTVTYTVYLRKGNSTLNSSHILGNTTSTSYSISVDWNSKYYWKIVATDEHGATTEGEVWWFKTGAPGGGGPPPPPSNQAPVADADGPYYGIINQTIIFDGSGSYDADGMIIAYQWDFGDGIIGTGVSPIHKYALPGTYIVTLKVMDDDYLTDTDTTAVYISNITGAIRDINPGENLIDATDETDTIITINASNSTQISIINFNETEIPENTTQTGIKCLGKCLNVSIENESVINWPIVIEIYYTQRDLENVNMTEKQLLGVYFWNETSGVWQLYNDTGVNTTNAGGYEGYCWANAWHLTLLAPGGDIEPPSKVTNLTVTDAKDGKLDLAWDSATDNVAVDHYNIYRDETFLTSVQTTSYQDTNLTNGHTYTYEVSAVDTAGNEGNKSDPATGTPTKTTTGGGGGDRTFIPPPPVNNPPDTPTTPQGVRAGFIDTNYTYTTSTSDPNGDDVYYWFDWGDNSNHGWLGPYGSGENVQASHTWSISGVYEVRVKAKDTGNMESGWSNTLTVTITAGANYPPNTPTKPKGPTTGDINVTYNFTTTTTDPDNNTIKYMFDWGDGTASTTELVSLGETITVSHNWTKEGTYNIRVKAIDQYLAESNWSQPHVFIVDSTKPIVSFITPKANVTLTAKANAHVSVNDANTVGVLFELLLGNTVVDSFDDTEYPYIWPMDVTHYENGNYKLRATAYDIAGNNGTASVSVIISKCPTGTPGFTTVSGLVAMLTVGLIFLKRRNK